MVVQWVRSRTQFGGQIDSYQKVILELMYDFQNILAFKNFAIGANTVDKWGRRYVGIVNIGATDYLVHYISMRISDIFM